MTLAANMLTLALLSIAIFSRADTLATNRPHLLDDSRWELYQKTLACWGSSSAGSGWVRREKPHMLWSVEEQKRGMCNPQVSSKYVGGCGSDIEARGEAMLFG